MVRICVIFDLDGTLVDSENLCNQAFLDLIPELNETVETLVQRHRGWKLDLIISDLSSRLDRPLPRTFVESYRARVAQLFETELRATPGAVEMLSSTSFPRCVASSGPTQKIEQALAICGLTHFFGRNIFSSYQIGSWKPDPGLFLYAAREMGVRPDQCVVVEDSEVGLLAAEAAGMRAIHYAPLSVAAPEVLNSRFSHMVQLPKLLEAIAYGA